MSRIGKRPLEIPKGVQVKLEGNRITVKGPKGELKRKIHETIAMKQDGTKLLFSQKAEDPTTRKFWGLSRTLVSNMVDGVVNGYSKSLTLVGVGYRAAVKGKGITVTCGLSHPVEFDPPQGITLTIDKQTTIIIAGPDKELVGDVAAKLRSYRPPEPYHGKGIRYSDEVVHTKVGKAAAGTTGAAGGPAK